MKEIVKDIDNMRLNRVYGISIINEENNIEKRELYILKGIMKDKYIFDRALIIQNNNNEKLLAISDNRYNEIAFHKCELKEMINKERVILLVELKDKENCC